MVVYYFLFHLFVGVIIYFSVITTLIIERGVCVLCVYLGMEGCGPLHSNHAYKTLSQAVETLKNRTIPLPLFSQFLF